jgi:hypothetical protein
MGCQIKKRLLLFAGMFFSLLISFGQTSKEPLPSVILLRAEGDSPGNKPVWIYQDGAKICSILPGQHISLSPSPGEHTFFVSFSAKRKLKARENETAFSIKCEAGKTMYLHIVSNPANRKNVSCTPIVESSAKKLLQDSKMRDCPSKK